MAVKLQSRAARFQHTAESTRRFFAIFEEFADDLELGKHPESLSQAAVNAFRNELIKVRRQWKQCETELIDACEQLADETEPEPVRMYVPREEDIQGAVGCFAVCVATALVVGVVIGSWIG